MSLHCDSCSSAGKEGWTICEKAHWRLHASLHSDLRVAQQLVRTQSGQTQLKARDQ